MTTTSDHGRASGGTYRAARSEPAVDGRLDVVTVASQGRDHSDADRIQTLLADLDPRHLDFRRDRKIRGALSLARRLLAEPPDAIVVEGTGIGVCLPVMIVSALRSTPYVISTGDAVAAYWALRRRWLWFPGLVYETLVYRRAAGVIGWTPYLVGRALTLGARRAMTAPGWAPTPTSQPDGQAIRQDLGIPDDATVFGIVGSLNWNRRHGYCYGYELVAALKHVDRKDIHVIIVGDGDGRARLADLAAGDERVHLPGRVPRDEVGSWVDAFDLASLPQTCDGVGMFRFTTKLPEYLQAGVPIVTGQTPISYDLDGYPVTQLQGDAPWSDAYIGQLGELMASPPAARRSANPPFEAPFNFGREQQRSTSTEFVSAAAAAAAEKKRLRKPR